MTTNNTFISTLASMISTVDIKLDNKDLVNMEGFAKEAGFDTNTTDAAVFATGVLIALADGLSVFEDNEHICLREYGRALVAGYRRRATTPLTSFYDYIKVSMEDKVLPAHAEATAGTSRRIGLACLSVFYKF